MLAHLCIPEINLTWLRCLILSICWRIWFARVLMMIFFVYIKNIGLYLSFLVLSLFLLVIMALLNELATIPSSYVFWKSLQRIGINSLMFGGIYQWRYLTLSFCFLEVFRLLIQFIICCGSILIFYFFLSQFCSLCVLKNLFISSLGWLAC